MRIILYFTASWLSGFKINKLYELGFSIVMSLALISCANTSVVIDYDPETDFSAIKTYAWQDQTQPQSGDPRIDNEITDRRIRNEINAGLATKGLHNVATEKAEILLSYQITIKAKLHNQGASGSIGLGKSSGGSSLGISLGVPLNKRNYDEETLILDIFEAQSAMLIWRGVAAREIDPAASLQENADRIKKLVAELLQAFPPKAKK